MRTQSKKLQLILGRLHASDAPHDMNLPGLYLHELKGDRQGIWSVRVSGAGITPEMAIRLSIAFDTSAESWLNQQAQYDLWLVRQKQTQLKVERIAA